MQSPVTKNSVLLVNPSHWRLKQMPGGSATDLATAQQLGGDEFDRFPVSFVSQQVFRFRQQTTLVPFWSGSHRPASPPGAGRTV